MNFRKAAIDKIVGTCLQGYITADFDELVAIFGEPEWVDSDKVDVEWILEFADGTVATIYNWKNGPNYLGDEGLPPEVNEDWHIGGRSQRAVELVEAALFDYRQGCTTVEEKPAALIGY